VLLNFQKDVGVQIYSENVDIVLRLRLKNHGYVERNCNLTTEILFSEEKAKKEPATSIEGENFKAHELCEVRSLFQKCLNIASKF
jgi:hypothetical protein